LATTIIFGKAVIWPNHKSKRGLSSLAGAFLFSKGRSGLPDFLRSYSCVPTTIKFPNKKQRQSPTRRNEQKLKPLDATLLAKACPYWRNKYLQKR